MNRWLFYTLTAGAAFLTITAGGCTSGGYGNYGYGADATAAGYDANYAPATTGTGRQVGTAVGAELGKQHGYLGSVLGGVVGDQVEKGATSRGE